MIAKLTKTLVTGPTEQKLENGPTEQNPLISEMKETLDPLPDSARGPLLKPGEVELEKI